MFIGPYINIYITFYISYPKKRKKVSINATFSRSISHHLYNNPMSHLPAFVCVFQNTKRQSLDPPCHLYATCAVLSKIYNVYHNYYLCCIKKLLLLLSTSTSLCLCVSIENTKFENTIPVKQKKRKYHQVASRYNLLDCSHCLYCLYCSNKLRYTT